MKKDPRIDAYIAKAADFAKPILRHLRELMHEGCPEVEETLKWSFPHFMHRGILGGMAAFKQHCTFGLWKGDLIVAKTDAREKSGMGQFGRITSLADLPADKVMRGYIREAVRLNETGVKAPARVRAKSRPKLVVPPELLAALRKNKKALATFENYSYSHQKEYVEWITGAKRDETRQKRLQTTVEWLAQGKSRNWKYEKC